jgi:Core binding factor beta subunit
MWGPRMGPGDPAAAAALAGMLPFDSIGLYEQPKPRFIFKMPRVVPDQKSKFESDELFRRLSRESEVNPFYFSILQRKISTILEKFLKTHNK